MTYLRKEDLFMSCSFSSHKASYFLDNDQMDFLKQFCLPGMEIEATEESILAALDDYQNEHPDPVSCMFEEFKVIED